MLNPFAQSPRQENGNSGKKLNLSHWPGDDCRGRAIDFDVGRRVIYIVVGLSPSLDLGDLQLRRSTPSSAVVTAAHWHSLHRDYTTSFPQDKPAACIRGIASLCHY